MCTTHFANIEPKTQRNLQKAISFLFLHTHVQNDILNKQLCISSVFEIFGPVVIFDKKVY